MSFLFSKIAWVVMSPGNLFVLLLLIAASIAASRRPVWRKRGVEACLALAILACVLAVLPVGAWLMTPLENKYPMALPDRVDGIILLAGDEDIAITKARGRPSAVISASRYIEFARLTRLYPDATFTFIGGTPMIVPTEGITNGDVARALLTDIGVDARRVLYEEKSRNTFENATYAMNLFHPSPQQNWVLVTSAFHMPRALAVFRKAGWNVFPDPVGYETRGSFGLHPTFSMTENLYVATVALREYVGLMAYWIMGRIDRPW